MESGPRYILERLLPHLRARYGARVPMDLVTCFPGRPGGIEQGAVYRVADYGGVAGMRRLFRELAPRGHSVLAMVCSGIPIMTKWKWALALRLPVKVLMVNENGDFFWLDMAHRRNLRHFVLFRAGLSGGGAVRTLARIAAFPFTLLYLLMYAAMIHLRRRLHE